MSFLDKEESLASPFNKKISYFWKTTYFMKQPSLLLNGKVIWQASDSSLYKELHVQSIRLKQVCVWSN